VALLAGLDRGELGRLLRVRVPDLVAYQDRRYARRYVDAVRRVAAGQSLLDPAVTRRVIDRLRQGPAQPTELAELTDQERRVLELVAEGLTNKQIAEAMFLAEKTIKNYVSSVLSKLGLERRTQAAVFATKMLRS